MGREQKGLEIQEGICTMDFTFIRSIVAESFLCARIEVRRNDLGTVNRLRGERSTIEHRDVRAWA